MKINNNNLLWKWYLNFFFGESSTKPLAELYSNIDRKI